MAVCLIQRYRGLAVLVRSYSLGQLKIADCSASATSHQTKDL